MQCVGGDETEIADKIVHDVFLWQMHFFRSGIFHAHESKLSSCAAEYYEYLKYFSHIWVALHTFNPNMGKIMWRHERFTWLKKMTTMMMTAVMIMVMMTMMVMMLMVSQIALVSPLEWCHCQCCTALWTPLYCNILIHICTVTYCTVPNCTVVHRTSL